MIKSSIQSSSSHTHLPQSSSSVEIPPKTRYKQKQNETHYENTQNVSQINVNFYDKAATSQQNSD
jgi:hypothetical protein